MIVSNKKRVAKISTASLPDIVFMLLFFFMVVTVIKPYEQLIKITYPKATELQKLENRSLIRYVSIGSPVEGLVNDLGNAPRIQLNDKIAAIDDVPLFVLKERPEIDEQLQSKMIISLKIDKDIKMGLVSEVKQALRKVNALKINYAAVRN